MSAAELHCVIDGPADGPPVILSSSLGTTHALWDAQREALASDHRVISYDHRGHGASAVPPGPYTIAELGADVIAVLDRLEIGRASWCGISLGGMVGLWLAANAPERIERLAVLCSAAQAPPASRWDERAAAVRAAGSVEVVADAVVERWFTPGFAAASPQLVAHARAMLVATPAEGYAGCCEAIARLDLRDDLRRIGAPTLVVSAADDTALEPAHGRAIAAAVPGARFELVAGAHLANIEDAAAVNALLTEHLALHDARRAQVADG